MHDNTSKRKIMFGDVEIDCSKYSILMGILNVTPDSFSDGGSFNSLEKAVNHAKTMLNIGADIIDIGGESTRPGSKFVSAEEEMKRVIPVLDAIKEELPKALVSIDTNKAEVAEAVLQRGADMINDVSAGVFDGRMLATVARYNVPICLMHTKDIPETMQHNTEYNDLISDIYQFLHSRINEAVKVGINRAKIIIDPGIGFGKTVNQNLQIIKNLSVFKGLGCPILIGTSRKSFIGEITGKEVESRIFGTAATVASSILNGANILRVHDVAEMKEVQIMTESIKKGAKYET